LGAAIEYLEALGSRLQARGGRDALRAIFEAIHEHECRLATIATDALMEVPGVRLNGTAKHKSGLVAFTLANAHPHDIGTILDHQGIAIRTGHHCCMPVMRRYDVPATARASFAFYNTEDEARALVEGVKKVSEVLG
jgi:cysteine desulfurase/selenocysteine lyase